MPTNAMLTQAHKDQYQEQGFVMIEGAVPPETVAEACAAVDALVDASRFVRANDDRYDLEDDHSATSPHVRRIKDPHSAHPVFENLLRGDLLLDIVAGLIGDNLRMHHTKLNIKPGHGGEAVEWHQDWAFYPHTNDDILEIGVMLDDCTADKGPLLMIPGSHKGRIYDHHHKGHFVGAIDMDDADFDPASAVPLIGPAGSITIHHVRMVHGSEPNMSAHDRRLLLHGYAAADAWPLVAYTFPDFAAHEANMLRGSSTLEPRLANVPVRMPYPPAPSQGSIFENQREVRGRSFGAAALAET